MFALPAMFAPVGVTTRVLFPLAVTVTFPLLVIATFDVPLACVPISVSACTVPEFANMLALVDRLPERVKPVNVPTEVMLG